MTAPVPAPALDGPWTEDEEVPGRRARRLRLPDGLTVEIERCVVGRLQQAYPVGAHDCEIRVRGTDESDRLAVALREVASAVLAADPLCRRVVYATSPQQPVHAEAAKAAGFRFTVEVDVPETVELFVREPAWVTEGDSQLDDVPGS
jgi:hypothetical protein